MAQKSELKLTYFNFKGLAEVARYILAYANVEYEDYRIDYFNDWAAIKKEQPYHQLPLLEAEGHLLTQSIAIWRYLAVRYKLSGKSDIHNARLDSIVFHISDLYEKLKVMQNEKKLKEYENEVMPFYLQRFEAMLQKQDSFYGNGITWAEITFAAIIDILESKGRVNRPVLEEYPRLLALRSRVVASPTLKAYLEKRQDTEW